MVSTTGHDAETLVPTGPGDLVDQLNRASGRFHTWPWAGLAVLVLLIATVAVPPVALAVLLLGTPGVIWLGLWERARRTVVIFYDVDGPRAGWYEQFTAGHANLQTLGGVWRIEQAGRVHDTYQYKVNSGASSLVARARANFNLAPPREFTTNISVPTVKSGGNSLLFLPDRVLVKSGSRWSDLTYEDLRMRVGSQRFIETESVPRDSRQVGTTWQYVNVKGGPDRRFKNNRQLPIMLYGELELTSASGLQWLLLCSNHEAAQWLATVLVPPRIQPSYSAQPVLTTTPAPHVAQPPVSRPPKRPVAEPRHVGSLFAYAGALSAQKSLLTHDGSFAVIDVETTGFSPRSGDRVIEIAIARVDRKGVVEDEYATLLNPEGRDTGPVYVHGITNDDVCDAPTFRDVAGDILNRLDSCVIVAHNASFEEQFLLAELTRCGIDIGPLPALCTLWLGRQTFRTPNHKLTTLAQAAGLSMADAHAALGDVRAVAVLLPLMLERYPEKLGYPCPPLISSAAGGPQAGTTRARTRAVALRRGTDGWMSSILARLPLGAADAGDADSERYLELLSYVMADGRIVAEEARALAELAGAAGFGSRQLAALNERFLESMREVALEDNVLTAIESKALNAAAKALGVPDYFDDLSMGEQTKTTPQPANPASRPTVHKRRCGNCRGFGHYRSTCPSIAENG